MPLSLSLEFPLYCSTANSKTGCSTTKGQISQHRTFKHVLRGLLTHSPTHFQIQQSIPFASCQVADFMGDFLGLLTYMTVSKPRNKVFYTAQTAIWHRRRGRMMYSWQLKLQHFSFSSENTSWADQAGRSYQTDIFHSLFLALDHHLSVLKLRRIFFFFTRSMAL